MSAHIIVIGAGACGLYASLLLGRAGNKITILEARDRIGGRIHTVSGLSFGQPVEGGAEFVHGDLPLTKKLLREAGMAYHHTAGRFWRSANGAFVQQEDVVQDEEAVIEKLKALQQDMPVKDFLHDYFPGERYQLLRQSLTSFVEGYAAADARKASSFALLQEMLGADSEQLRPEGGYGKLADYLHAQCRANGAEVVLSAAVTAVTWRSGAVTVTAGDQTYHADKVIVTLPVGVLQAAAGEQGSVSIHPLPAGMQEAIHALGNTGVIKTILQFEQPFWNDHVKKLGFLFSNEAIPTWWTQLPSVNAVLTGWLAGPAAVAMKDASSETILELGMRSLARIFGMNQQQLRSQLAGWHIFNWTSDPFTRGAYGYERVTSKNARRTLGSPLGDTLYFAGEALHDGPERGTVEAALANAEETVRKIVSPA